ncbi:MAG: hypothetical protein ACE5FH_09365 [Candidatus Zixiibacteriota bacterium]
MTLIKGVRLRVLLILAFVGLAPIIQAQSCSCGGAPLLGSVDLPAASAGSWQLALGYEFSSVSDLFDGSTRLDDNTRRRKVFAGTLELSYGLTERVSLSALFTLLQQERQTLSQTGTGSFLRTRGFGDGLFMVKYKLIPWTVFSQRELSIGLGVKVPFGKSRLIDNSLLISADMQPGTGAWDGVVWANIYQGFYRLAPVGVFASGIYRTTGSNHRFGVNQAGYEFGNELNVTAGADYNWRTLFNLSVGLRYRYQGADQFGSVDQPNSGGKWLQLVPGLNLNLFRGITTRLSGQLPLYRKLEGTQFTTEYSFSATILYAFAKGSAGDRLQL